jgi:hypothetical protein
VTRELPLLILLALALACASPRIGMDDRFTAVPSGGAGPLIEVREFAAPDSIANYEPPASWLGVDLAQRVVFHLRRDGRRAFVAPAAGTGTGDVVVQGKLADAHGGSAGARMWVGFGAGGATCAVSAQFTRRDGSSVGSFEIERRSSRYRSAILIMQACIDRIGRDVAEAVPTGG